MSDAYFLQIPRIILRNGGPEEVLAKMILPTGSYVILAKFNVAAAFGADTHGQPNISHFYLTYRGERDASYCDLRENGELKTVVLTLAAGITAQEIARGRARPSAVRLVCDGKGQNLEVAHICITAISVDGVEKLQA